MPSYEFCCRNADCEAFAVIVTLVKPMRAEAPVCPECGEKMERIYRKGDGSFALKGKGWYRDGYEKGGR